MRPHDFFLDRFENPITRIVDRSYLDPFLNNNKDSLMRAVKAISVAVRVAKDMAEKAERVRAVLGEYTQSEEVEKLAYHSSKYHEES